MWILLCWLSTLLTLSSAFPLQICSCQQRGDGDQRPSDQTIIQPRYFRMPMFYNCAPRRINFQPYPMIAYRTQFVPIPQIQTYILVLPEKYLNGTNQTKCEELSQGTKVTLEKSNSPVDNSTAKVLEMKHVREDDFNNSTVFNKTLSSTTVTLEHGAQEGNSIRKKNEVLSVTQVTLVPDVTSPEGEAGTENDISIPLEEKKSETLQEQDKQENEYSEEQKKQTEGQEEISLLNEQQKEKEVPVSLEEASLPEEEETKVENPLAKEVNVKEEIETPETVPAAEEIEKNLPDIDMEQSNSSVSTNYV